MTNWKSNRRKFVASLGSLGVAGLSGIVSGSSENQKATVIKGSISKPISNNGIRDAQKEQLSRNGFDPGERRLPVVKRSSGEVVGYACKVMPNGKIKQSINIAGSPRDVAKAHSRADEVAEALNRGENPFKGGKRR